MKVKVWTVDCVCRAVVLRVYPAESWAPRVRAQEFFTIGEGEHSSFRKYAAHPEIRKRSPRAMAICEIGVGTNNVFLIFTVRRSALHGLCDRNSVRPSVCPSVRLSHSWTVSTWFNLRS